MHKISAFFIVSVICFAACKKPSSPSPAKFTGCRISQITEVPADTTMFSTPRTVYNFYYNDDGTVQHMYVFIAGQPYSSYYKYFTYSGDRIITRAVYAQQSYSEVGDTLFLDGQNRVAAIHHGYQYYSSYSNPQNDENTYNSSGQVYLHRFASNGNFYTDTLVWQNGDPLMDTRVLEGNGVSDIYYYTYDSTVYNTGNITANLKDFENYGRGTYTSSHLLKQVYDHHINLTDTTKAYTYTLDAAGKITNIAERIAGGGVATTQVVYNCQ